jgi:DNA-binding transcriptional ArsR family regulator
MAIDEFLHILRAAGSKTRLAILYLLMNIGEMTGGEISQALHKRPSTISRHLTMLKQAHLLTSRGMKKFVYYRIAETELTAPVLSFLNLLKEKPEVI